MPTTSFAKRQGLSFRSAGPGLFIGSILAIAGGLLQALSWSADWLWPLCLLALVPLIVAVDGQSGRRAFFLGWLYGLGLSLGALPWLADVMSGYGGLGPVLGWLILLLLSLYLALYQGLFAWIISLHAKWMFAWAIMGSIAWCGLDWLKNWVMTGFNWTPLAGPLSFSTGMGQAADIFGFYGLGFFVALFNFFIAALVLKRRGGLAEIWPYLACLAVLLGSAMIYGQARYSKWESVVLDSPKKTVAVVQPSVPQENKWDEKFRNDILSRYQQLTHKAESFSPWLIIWPETAFPFIFDHDYTESEWLRELSSNTSAPMLVGVTGLGGQWPKQTIHNRAWLFTGGDPGPYYDKKHLVPFGEYVPLDQLPFLKLTFMQGLIGAAGNYAPGKDLPPIDLPLNSDKPDEDRVRLGIMICFESTFPYQVRARAGEGAGLLVVTTNDGWFGRSRAPRQHLYQSVMRAIETRRPLVRVGNNGLSALIYPSGRQAFTSQLYDIDAFAMDAPILKEAHLKKTPFVRWGYALAPLCAILTAFLLIIRFFKK